MLFGNRNEVQIKFTHSLPPANKVSWVLRMRPAGVRYCMLSITNKIQRNTIFFIAVKLSMFQAVSPPIIRSSKTVHTTSGMCQACLLLPLAVTASKLGTYPMSYVQFLSSLWWAGKPPETWRALAAINTRVETLIVATIYVQLIQNGYMFRSFTVLQCSHQHCVQPVASDVEVVGYL